LHCAKNYRNQTVYVKIIASRRWDFFETHCRSDVTLFESYRPAKHSQPTDCSTSDTKVVDKSRRETDARRGHALVNAQFTVLPF